MCNYKYKYLIPLVIIRLDGEEYLLPTGVWRSLFLHPSKSFTQITNSFTPRNFSRLGHVCQTEAHCDSGLLSVCIFTNIVHFLKQAQFVSVGRKKQELFLQISTDSIVENE